MCFWILLGLIQTLIYLYPGLVNTMEGDHPKRYLSVRCISESHLGHSLFFGGEVNFQAKSSHVILVSCKWLLYVVYCDINIYILDLHGLYDHVFFSLTSDCCESQKSCLFMYVLWVQICDVSNIITQRLYWKPSIQLGSYYIRQTLTQ